MSGSCKTLNQNERSPMAVEEQVVVIYAATNGFVDRVAVDRVPEFHEDLVSRMRAEHADVLEKIAGGKWDDDIVETVHDAVEEFAEDFGYDIDEDGVADRVRAPTSRRPSTRATPTTPTATTATTTADEPEKEAAPA